MSEEEGGGTRMRNDYFGLGKKAIKPLVRIVWRKTIILDISKNAKGNITVSRT